MFFFLMLRSQINIFFFYLFNSGFFYRASDSDAGFEPRIAVGFELIYVPT